MSMRVNRTMTVLALTGTAFVLLALFVTPHGKPFSMRIDLGMLPKRPQILEVTAPKANIDIVIADSPKAQILAQGELHGFGWPGSRLETSVALHALPAPTVSFRIEGRGWITDLSAWATLTVPSSGLQRVVVRLKNGNIHVTDETQSRVVHNGILRLDLHTDLGRVQKPVDASSGQGRLKL